MAKRIDCFVCGKENLSRDEKGLNKKLIGRNIERFHCIDCLAEFLGVSTEDLFERIEEFKNDGCTLFS